MFGRLTVGTVAVWALIASFAPAVTHAACAPPNLENEPGVANQGIGCIGSAFRQAEGIARGVGNSAQRVGNTAWGLGKATGDYIQGKPPGQVAADVLVPAVTGDDNGWTGAQNSMQKGANGSMQRVGQEIASIASPNLQADWFKPEFSIFALLAGFLAVPLLCLAVVDSVIHQDWRSLGRSLFIYLPFAAIGGIAFTAFGNAILEIIDRVCGIIIANGAPVARVLSEGAFGVGAIGVGFGPVAGFVTGLVVFIFGLLIWFELALRAGALYLVALFVPLCLAAMIWPRHVQIGGRAIRAGFAVGTSKIVIFAALTLAAALLGKVPVPPPPGPPPPGVDPVNDGLIAIGLIVLAALSPAALYALIPLAGEAAAAGAQTVRHAIGDTAATPQALRGAAGSGVAALQALRNRGRSDGMPMAGLHAAGGRSVQPSTQLHAQPTGGPAGQGRADSPGEDAAEASGPPQGLSPPPPPTGRRGYQSRHSDVDPGPDK